MTQCANAHLLCHIRTSTRFRMPPSACCLSLLSHLDPIGAASFSEEGTHINSQAAITTRCSTAWMLVHLFAPVPLLLCQLRYAVWSCHALYSCVPQLHAPILQSTDCGVTDAGTLNVQFTSTQRWAHLWKVWVEWNKQRVGGRWRGKVACVGYSLWAEEGKCNVLVYLWTTKYAAFMRCQVQ